jgi:hypothetical protein
MIYGAIAAFELSVITVFVAVVVLLAPTHPVFADSYEKTQTISQINECGNYWFPVNIICSNLSSQVQGDKNDAATVAATPPESQRTDSAKNYGTPFP